MTLSKINVNSADINSAHDKWPDMPFDLMGLLFFAYRDFVRESDNLLEQRGFGRAHHRVLYFVAMRPQMPVAELLDVLQITKQSLARVLRQLIDEGYIVQIQGEEDRRQRLLSLAPKGAELFEMLSSIQSKRILNATENLDPQQVQTIKTFLTNMVDIEEMGQLAQLGLRE